MTLFTYTGDIADKERKVQEFWHKEVNESRMKGLEIKYKKECMVVSKKGSQSYDLWMGNIKIKKT